MAGRRRSILALCLFTSCSFTISSEAFSAETVNYSYDARGRLVKVSRAGTTISSPYACYSYDRADNRTNVTATASECSSAPPTMSVADASATEGSLLNFIVTRSGSTSAAATVSYATSNGSAIAGSDYIAVSNSLTFAIGETSKTIAVSTTDDSTVESGETVNLTLSSPTGATLADGAAIGTINDNDAPCGGVSFSVESNGAITEGATSGFTVRKDGSTSSSCAVNYATANGTAVAPGDYTAKSTTTMTFTSGQSSQTVNITTVDDSIVESAENFTLNLSSPTDGAAIGTGSATGNINDNDVANPCSGVTFSVLDAEEEEGNSLVVTIQKSGTATGSCSVSYATANNTAVAPADYTPASTTVLNFASNESSKTVSIFLSPDSLVEFVETFYVNLTNATGGASISDAQAVGTIIDATPEQCFDENNQPIPCNRALPPDEPPAEQSMVISGEEE